jgi:SAM-dependent methyltransferase
MTRRNLKENLGKRMMDATARIPNHPAHPGQLACRICGGTIRKTFERFECGYGKCSICGSVQKLMTDWDYAAIEVTYDPGELLAGLSAAELRDVLDIDMKKDFLRRHLRGVKGETPTFLDIGCGQGEQLLAARELGCSCLGIEPSLTHSKNGRDHFNLEILDGYFDLTRLGGRRFDIIMLSHVIEHIYDPIAFFAQVVEALAPSGRIILITPNAASVVAMATRKYWCMLKPPDHVTMFTPRAFRSLTPPGFTCDIHTSEHSWEPAAVVFQALRDFVREWKAAEPAAPTTHMLGALKFRKARKRYLLKVAEILSSPLHLLGITLNRQACLVAVIRKAE